MREKEPVLYIVMPCYNEEAGLADTIQTVSATLRSLMAEGRVAQESAMLFSDDGSRDGSWMILEDAHEKQPQMVKAVKLAGNRGKEYALWAGVMEARLHADVVVCMDADLQFDIGAIPRFLELYAQGYDLVYGIKNNRGKEPLYKRLAASLFYALMRKLGSPVLRNHSDYCLMSRQVCDALSEYGETNLIFRGLLRSLGFRQRACHFDVKDREAGESHFSARQLLNLSLDAITSFSTAPLRLIGGLGCLIFLVSLIMIAWTFVDVFRGGTPGGYATLVCSLWFLGGLGMISMSLLGEYIGKMYLETKKRPRYYVEKVLS